MCKSGRGLRLELLATITGEAPVAVPRGHRSGADVSVVGKQRLQVKKKQDRLMIMLTTAATDHTPQAAKVKSRLDPGKARYSTHISVIPLTIAAIDPVWFRGTKSPKGGRVANDNPTGKFEVQCYVCKPENDCCGEPIGRYRAGFHGLAGNLVFRSCID